MIFLLMTSLTTRARILKAASGAAQLAHGVEEAPMDWLQTVSRNVGQGPVHDGREGVGEINVLERAQIDWQHFAAGPEPSFTIA